MSIQALPVSTIQLLGPSMKIISPHDLVKELIDNAIDAEATSIEITISSNTIDRVTVRDNGSGIDIDDFDSLGKPSHTSKIRTIEEIAALGGKSLGFRGESLHNANSLAEIVITTKKLRDPVAWRIELAYGVGGIKNKRPVSSTVGTIVAATRLFENMPPRKQLLLKNKKKTISRIQNTLKAYALARPHIKMSFKLVGHAKPLWSYSPAGAATRREAILQLFGASFLNHCIELKQHLPHYTSSSTEKCPEPDGWIVAGYVGVQLPKTSSSQALFVSIDGRPMSSDWNVSKKLVSTLKSHMVENAEEAQSSQWEGRLFVNLSIQCPPGSYDANITSRKDEVLLADENSLLQGFENVCRDMSGKLGQHRCHTSSATSSGNQSLAAKSCDRRLGFLSSVDRSKEFKDDASFRFVGQDLVTSGPKTVSHGKQHVVGHSDNNKSTIKTTLRTSFTVDFSKKEDCESETEDVANLVEVEIPPRKMSLQAKGHRSTENILQYFLPVSAQDFEIASDNTATTTTTTTTEEVDMEKEREPSVPRYVGRCPLKPITASDLNRIRDKAESRPGQPGSVSLIPYAGRVMRASNEGAELPLDQRDDSLDRRNRRRGEEPVGHSQDPPTRIQSVEGHQQDDDVHEPLIAPLPLILTPPPSDPRYRNEPDSPTFEPRLRLFGLSPPRETTVIRATNRPDVPTNIQSFCGENRRSGNNASGQQRSSSISPALRQDEDRFRFDSKRRRQVTHSAKIPHGLAAQMNSKLAIIPEERMKTFSEPLSNLMLSQRPRSTTRKATYGSQGVSLGYSHALQIGLARTPAPKSPSNVSTTSSRQAKQRGAMRGSWLGKS